jgi:DNA polymerase-1
MIDEWGIFYQGPNKDKPVEWKLKRLWNPPYGKVAIDTETISTTDKTCVGVGFAISPDEAYYIPLLPTAALGANGIIEVICSNRQIAKIFHNAHFDLDTLTRFAKSEELVLPDISNVADTGIIINILGLPGGLYYHGYLLGFENLFTIPELLDKVKNGGIKRPNTLDIDTDDLAQKCINDCLVTYRLWEKYESTAMHNECYAVDSALLSILQTTQRRGLGLDQETLQAHDSSLSRDIELLRLGVEESYGINVGSTKQLSKILLERGNYLPLTKSGKNVSVNDVVLAKLDDPLAKLAQAYRGAVKKHGTYVVPYLHEERAYTHFRMDLSTARLASYDRNLQNIPPELRDIFSPDNEIYVYPDMSQVEMRVFAHQSQDPVLQKAYSEGADVHWITQSTLWPGSDKNNEVIRRRAKTFNFAMIYNATASTLALRTGLSYRQCEIYRQRWLQLYSGGAKWMEAQKQLPGDTIASMYDRTMRLPDIGHSGQKHVETCRINYPIQNGASEIAKRSLIHCWNNGLDDAFRLPLHDEFLFDGDIEFPADELAHIYPGLYTPWDIKRGPKWQK